MYYAAFGFLAALLVWALYVLLAQIIVWPHYYFTWVMAISVITFLFYGVDKGLAKAQKIRARVPEIILNLLTLAGGTPGAWLGRTVFRHKINLRRHWLMFAILVASSLLHVYVLHTLYSESLAW
jgi:uncharacterized membrane protein YsdA (DUF1294 family)